MLDALQRFAAVLSYDVDASELTFSGTHGEVRASVRVPAPRLADWVSRRVEPAVEVFTGSPADAAWQLVLVELEEDLDLGRDPFAVLRGGEGPTIPAG